MSRELFSRNPDLKRLRDEGYFVQQQGGYLVMREVPYVDARRELGLKCEGYCYDHEVIRMWRRSFRFLSHFAYTSSFSG
jgi:hypothetical protein